MLMALTVFVASEMATKQRRPPPPSSFNPRERRAAIPAEGEPRAPRAGEYDARHEMEQVQVWSEDVDVDRQHQQSLSSGSSGKPQPRTVGWSAGPGH